MYKLKKHGNNKKYQNKEDSIFNDQKVERREEDIKEEKRSQFYGSEYSEFLL